MLAPLGENWMFDVWKDFDPEGCEAVVTGCLNFLVSHSLIVSSPPLVTTSLPSGLISTPLIHVSFVCASRISLSGLVKGPSPLHITKLPSRAPATSTLFPPCAGYPQATAVILLLPAEPAAFDLCTITSFCDRPTLISHIRSVL